MQRENRRLAAIVAADIAGYSRLIGQDEEGTLRALRAHRTELIDPLIEQHGGRIANTAGDSLLLEFASAVDAVRCAIAFQKGMAERNVGIEWDRSIVFRIGINVGDVVAQGGDLLGDGVNVAARLEGLCEPGSLCLSATAYEYISGNVDADFIDGGKHEVKNIARPVHVWRWSKTSRQAAPTASTVSQALPLPDKPSIAVLPFDNMSRDPEQEYFSDGVAEDVITALSRLHWLFVISRNSTFIYKGAAVDVKRIGHELGVRYVLEGSVRKAGQRVRVTAQLVEVETGHHVWADKYDRELDDIFAIQDDIVTNIVGSIDSELRASEITIARRKPPSNLDAWGLYQRGLWHTYKMSAADILEAQNLFKQAVERDPTFALAHAGVAFTWALVMLHGVGDATDNGLAAGIAAGEQAVALDEMDGFNHFALGRLLNWAGQGERAIAELKKSVALNPSFARGYHGLGLVLNWYGYAEEAIVALDKAIRLSPHDPMMWGMQSTRASCSNNLGHFVEAEEWCRIAVTDQPGLLWPNITLIDALVGQNKIDDACSVMATILHHNPKFTMTDFHRLSLNYHPKNLDRVVNALRLAGLPE